MDISEIINLFLEHADCCYPLLVLFLIIRNKK